MHKSIQAGGGVQAHTKGSEAGCVEQAFFSVSDADCDVFAADRDV